MNITILIGRLTKEIEIRTTQSGTAIANFDLAVNRDKDNTDFIKCVAMGKSAEILKDYTNKGSQIGIEGKIQTRSYEAKNGEKRSVTEVFVNRVQLLEKRQEQPYDAKKGTAKSLLDTSYSEPAFEVQDDDLPF